MSDKLPPQVPAVPLKQQGWTPFEAAWENLQETIKDRARERLIEQWNRYTSGTGRHIYFSGGILTYYPPEREIVYTGLTDSTVYYLSNSLENKSRTKYPIGVSDRMLRAIREKFGEN